MIEWLLRKIAGKRAEIIFSTAMAEVYEKGERQRFDYECKWHSEREDKRIELAKLDAEIEYEKRLLASFSSNSVNAIQQKEIERLFELLKTSLNRPILQEGKHDR
jgi:hypothetical protein